MCCWKQLLTITLPVGSYQALLVPAFLLVLVTVVVGLSLALRSIVDSNPTADVSEDPGAKHGSALTVVRFGVPSAGAAR